MLRSGSCATTGGIPTPGEVGQVRPADGPSNRHRVSAGVAATSATVRRPSRCRGLGRLVAYAPQGTDRQQVQELHHPIGGTTNSPSRFAERRGQFGHELARSDPTEQVMPLFVVYAVADHLADLTRRAQPSTCPGHIQERLVQAEGLHHRGQRRNRDMTPALASV